MHFYHVQPSELRRLKRHELNALLEYMNEATKEPDGR